MKDTYPDYGTVPIEWLVDPEGQPDYLDWGSADPGEEVNLADLLVDRHVRSGRGEHVAIAGESSVEPGPASSQAPASKPIASTTTQSKNAAPKPATLLVGPVDTKRAGDSVALSVSARDLTGGFVVISGFAPGTSLSVGTLLGDNGINIGTFNLGRREAGGEAVLLLSVDGAVPAQVRDAACKLPGVKRVMALSF